MNEIVTLVSTLLVLNGLNIMLKAPENRFSISSMPLPGCRLNLVEGGYNVLVRYSLPTT